MQPGQPRLAIDYGAACTQAVVSWPDGRWQPLSFDTGQTLSSAVHTGNPDEVLVGSAAWRQAQNVPDGFIPAPLRAGTGTVSVAGAQVEVADLVAATLRHVAAETARLVGGPVTDVRMVVPAGWGPRRRTWLRHAAHRAGLAQPRLVEAPAAAADRLLAVGVQVPVGAYLLMCDVGAGCEVSVLRRGPTGFEVLSTIADPAAGGDRIDELLITALLGDAAPGPESSRGTVLAGVRAAKEALSQQPVVTVTMPHPAPPVVVTSVLVQEAAQPVLKRVTELATEAVANAELNTDQLAGTYCIGAASAMPAVAPVIAEQTGTLTQVLAQPGFAAVLGAAEAGAAEPGTTPAMTATAPSPAWRRPFALIPPAVASLALYAHFLLTATFHNGTPDDPGISYYVMATWGELAVATLFALITCLGAGSLFGAALQQQPQPQRSERYSPDPVGRVDRIAGGIAVAAGTALAIAGLYAITAGVYFNQPLSDPLRWAFLPILPIALSAAATAWLAARRRVTPPRQGWDAFLAFPTSSVITTAVGVLLVAIWWHGPIPTLLNGWSREAAALGGLLIGIGIATALAQRLPARVMIGVPLALFAMIIAVSGAVGILAAMYASAATVWWGRRVWQLLRVPDTARHGT